MPSPVIYQGNKAKNLKDELQFKNGMSVMNLLADPQSTAASANKGSFGSYAGRLYRKLDDGSSTNWDLLYSASDVVKNYLSQNANADIDVTGWTRYANTSASSSPDNFGGSPNAAFTWTRNTSSPLAGLGDFLLTKDAANRQGHGIYKQFTLENADLHSMLRLAAKATTSANYVDNDIKFFLVGSSDNFVANFDILPFDPAELLAGAQGTVRGEKQTHATNTAYRFCIHIATTNANAYTVNFDRWNLGPTQYAFGTPDSYLGALTTTGSWTTNTNYTGSKYWRRGDKLIGDVIVNLTGAPDNTALLITLPNGLNIDTSKITQVAEDYSTYLGSGIIRDTATASYLARLAYSSATQIRVMAVDSAAVMTQMSASVPVTFANGDKITIHYEVPILGWSSSTQMSDDADTRIVGFTGTNNAGTTLTSAAETKIPFATVRKDTHGKWDAGNSWYVCASSGDFYVNFNLLIANRTYTAGDVIQIRFYKGGTQYEVYYNVVRVAAANIISIQVSKTIRDCVAGDYIYIAVRVDNTSGNSAIDTNFTDATFLDITKIQGPSSIAASEKVLAKMVDSSTSLTYSSAVTLVCATKKYDTHGALNIATGVFTCPSNGKYRVSANGTTTSSTADDTSDRYFKLIAVKSGSSSESTNGNWDHNGFVTTAKNYTSYVSDEFDCIKGDTLLVQGYQFIKSSGVPTMLSGADRTSVTFEKVS